MMSATSLPSKGLFCTECEEILPTWKQMTRHHCIAKMIGCGLDLSDPQDRALAEDIQDPHKYDCRHCGHSVEDAHAPNCPAEDWLRDESDTSVSVCPTHGPECPILKGTGR